MALAGLMRAGEQRVDDAKRGPARDAAARDAVAGANDAARIGGGLERAHDARADRDDATLFRFGARDRRRGPRRDSVRLVERQAPIERGIAGRGKARRMAERGEADAALAPSGEHRPVERISRGRRFEGDRRGGDARPDVPKRERRRKMGVLDRPAVTGEAGDNCVAAAEEAQRDQPGMVEYVVDNGVERAEGEPVARGERRRKRPVFRTRAPIARAEGDGDETGRIAEPDPAGKANLHRRAARDMRSFEARRQSRGVVRHDQVAGREQVGEFGPRRAPHAPIGTDDQQLAAAAIETLGGDHARDPTGRKASRPWRSDALIASAISAAASSGGFSVDGSVSGEAKACSGVSMSPGSSERKRTPSSLSSLSQIAVRWRSAALLAP